MEESISNMVIAILTGAICVLTFVSWRVYMKQAWLAAALESHSLLMLRMEAKKNGIPLYWWDPDIAPAPTAGARGHNVSADLHAIYLYLPQHERHGWKSAGGLSRFRRWLNAEI